MRGLLRSRDVSIVLQALYKYTPRMLEDARPEFCTVSPIDTNP